jgi:Uncharacterized conserved protein (COG2071)
MLRRRLQRHPIPMVAHFRHSLVLAYAFPRAALERFLPPPFVLDAHGEDGLAAVALVQTQRLRPAFAPAPLGRSFFLCGYRIFVRLRHAPSMRGLYILRSDTDRRMMVVFGNLLTHYRYRKADVRTVERPGYFEVEVRTPHGEADLHVVADLSRRPQAPPEGSPFTTLGDARKYAGPLPYTFDYERETGSVVLIRGVRSAWNPQPIAVDAHDIAYFDDQRFGGGAPVLANAFHVAGVDYRWERGKLFSSAERRDRETPSTRAA